MKLLLAYRAYKQLMMAPCHNSLYPVLGDFYVTKATFCLIQKIDKTSKLPEFISLIPDSSVRNNLKEIEYIESMPREYVRVFLTDEEKFQHHSGTMKKTVWECFDNLLNIVDRTTTNHMCKRKTMHSTCLQNLVKSLAKNACAACASLYDIKCRLNVH